MATVWTTMEKTPEGRYAESSYSTIKPEKPYRSFTVDDPEEFIAHMQRFNRIPKKALARDEYEKVCGEFGVNPAADKDLKIYGTTYTARKTNAYSMHTVPENRQHGIAYTIHGLRFRGLQTGKA